MQVLRNIQRQKHATIYEEKQIGSAGENKQEKRVFNQYHRLHIVGWIWIWDQTRSYMPPAMCVI